MAVPYIFEYRTGNIPLSELDANFTYFTTSISVTGLNTSIGGSLTTGTNAVIGTTLNVGTNASIGGNLNVTGTGSGASIALEKLLIVVLKTLKSEEFIVLPIVSNDNAESVPGVRVLFHPPII